ncbi:PIN domain-containing protein [bacterium]|nr:PIN domain-containing protein [bacterium]
MIRATLDTPVLVAGLGSRGASYRILQALIAGRFEAAVSVALFLEYEDVLTRPAILKERIPDLTADDVLDALDYLAGLFYLAQPIYYQPKPALPDPGDEKVLECVVRSQSQCLVTMNHKHFREAAPLFGFQLVTPGDFLNLLQRSTSWQ